MVIQILPISTLLALSVDEQDEMARELVKMERKTNASVETHKSAFPIAGKTVYVMQKRLEMLKSCFNPDGTAKKPAINAAVSFSSYWEFITKTDGKSVKLNPHWFSCAVAFGTYVGSELITEADYDKNPGSNLELAASISTQVGHDITHDAVTAAAEELRDRSKN